MVSAASSHVVPEAGRCDRDMIPWDCSSDACVLGELTVSPCQASVSVRQMILKLEARNTSEDAEEPQCLRSANARFVSSKRVSTSPVSKPPVVAGTSGSVLFSSDLVVFSGRSAESASTCFGPRYGPARAPGPARGERVMLKLNRVEISADVTRESSCHIAPDSASACEEAPASLKSSAERDCGGSAVTCTLKKLMEYACTMGEADLNELLSCEARDGVPVLLIRSSRESIGPPVIVRGSVVRAKCYDASLDRERYFCLSARQLAKQVRSLRAVKFRHDVSLCTRGGSFNASVGGLSEVMFPSVHRLAGSSMLTLGLLISADAAKAASCPVSNNSLFSKLFGETIAVCFDVLRGELYDGVLYIHGRVRESGDSVLLVIKLEELLNFESHDGRKQRVLSMIDDDDLKIVAASAVGGATVVGSAGAAAGTVLGSLAGAAVGIVPALFTFGLSIPVCAMMGGSAGLVAGATTGAGTGMAIGTAAGCGGLACRNKLRSFASMSVERSRT
eukprot:TRINITY_DN31898_c0_g1_i1.p1 TRINITY_DN31898_c0_g1~~TRINITY_DN31898_c0_g1_i1.p1  ORF type:complete len:505 (-),score=49.48 TRINITY_DN31898_c0_g1_i1:362-1876(-)